MNPDLSELTSNCFTALFKKKLFGPIKFLFSNLDEVLKSNSSTFNLKPYLVFTACSIGVSILK